MIRTDASRVRKGSRANLLGTLRSRHRELLETIPQQYLSFPVLSQQHLLTMAQQNNLLDTVPSHILLRKSLLALSQTKTKECSRVVGMSHRTTLTIANVHFYALSRHDPLHVSIPVPYHNITVG